MVSEEEKEHIDDEGRSEEDNDDTLDNGEDIQDEGDELENALDEAWEHDEDAVAGDAGDDLPVDTAPGTNLSSDGEVPAEDDTEEIMDQEDLEEEGDESEEDDISDEPIEKEAGGVEETAEDYENIFIKSQIEAVLFVTSQGVTAEEINVKLGLRKSLVEELLEELAFDYLDRSTSLEIAKVGEKYVLQLKPEFTSYVKKFASGGLIREAVMRTLTIVAAKQPILQSQLSKLRSNAGEHLKEMEELGLIKREPKGRSKMITTTTKFADMFGFSRDISKMKEQIKIYLMQESDSEE